MTIHCNREIVRNKQFLLFPVFSTRLDSRLIVLGFDAPLTAKVMAASDARLFPGFPIPVLTQLSFQSHRLPFSLASKVRSKNTSERKVASTGYRTHNHQFMSQTCSPLNHLGVPFGELSAIFITFKNVCKLFQFERL